MSILLSQLSEVAIALNNNSPISLETEDMISVIEIMASHGYKKSYNGATFDSADAGKLKSMIT